jgi:hypothetical protein
MILPYVYKTTHRETGKFYIGFRCANKHPAEQDLGVKYFTSSKTVRESFCEYDVEIIAVFFSKASAYEFEQSLIGENFENPLLINKHWQKTGIFSMAGTQRPDFAAYNTLTKSRPKELRTYVCPECGISFVREEFCHHPVRDNPTCSHSCNGKWNSKKRASRKGIPINYVRLVGSRRGKRNPWSAENGKKGAAKQSAAKMGRRKVWNEDGSWIWTKPGDARYPETKTAIG